MTMTTARKRAEGLLEQFDITVPPVFLGHQPALDGMRAVAVFMVLGNHVAGGHFPGGGLGVDVFFVLSGFLITRLLIEEWRTTSRICILSFYWRRACRLLPALLLVVLFVFAAPRLMTDIADTKQLINLRDIVAPILYCSNWVLMAHYDEPSLMPHAWSLSVEEQFYLIWPLVLIVTLRKSVPLSTLLRWASAAIVVASVVMAIRASFGTPSVVLYAGPESRGAVMLMTGATLAFAFDHIHAMTGRLTRFTRFGWPVALAAIAFLVLNVTQSTRFLYYGGWLVVAVPIATLLIAALNKGTLLYRILSVHVMAWMGTISYGLYLWQVPVIRLTEHVLKPHGYGSEAVAAIAAPTSVLLAILSFYLVERPIRRRGRCWLTRRHTLSARRSQV
jgi:peptidoglycan/LPS O-acetylase OafA/YrhL